MPLEELTAALRDRASGRAVYILDPPEDRCGYLRSLGFGIFRTVPAYHREHPHSAYLFGAPEGREGLRRTQTLVLPSGSLKRTQVLRGGSWENETEYCFRPHHWEKLGLHLTDLIAVAEHYPARDARSRLEAGDLLAAVLPPSPLEMLVREFVSADYLEKTKQEEPAALRKALRQLEPFYREALAACTEAECDLYLKDDRTSPVLPDSFRETLRNEYREVKDAAGSRPVLTFAGHTEAGGPGTVLSPCPSPENAGHGADCILIGNAWPDHLEEWKTVMAENGHPVFLIPWQTDRLTELIALAPAQVGCESPRPGVE